jgi:hypothetical protein
LKRYLVPFSVLFLFGTFFCWYLFLLNDPALVRSPEVLRGVRAVEVLEQIDTTEGQRLLESLAQGTPEARLTQEAKASLERLSRRHAWTP